MGESSLICIEHYIYGYYEGPSDTHKGFDKL